MATDITVPAVGESITEGVIAQWLVADGAYVEEGSPIYELETDKISSEIVAEISGVLSHKAQEGDTVEVGAVIATIDSSAEKPASNDRGRSAAEVQAERASDGQGGGADDADTHWTPTEDQHQPEQKSEPSHLPLSPAVEKLVAEHGINPAAIVGTGKDGRLTKGDVLAYIDQGKKPAAPAASAPAASTPPAAASAGDVDRKPMSQLRKRIAQRLVNAQRTAAILTTFNEIDMAPAMALRSKYKERFEETHGTKLGFMSFFTKACVEALKAYPAINSQIDGDDVVEYQSQHIGVAVGTEKGLVVPVLKNAQDMSFADIEREIRVYAKKARDGKISLADMSGGTFTITNGGVYGSLMSTPIINPPQSGILGMHSIKERPVAINGEVVIRPMMYVALSYDHRIVDGAGAVGFLVRVKELLEEPERLIFGL